MGGTHGATDRELWGEDLAWAVVLIVDDQQPNVMLLERLLARMGVGRTVGVTDPREALGLYRSLDPDLVLVDWHMPHLDGLGILTALEPSAAQDAFTPVVVLTADTTGAAREAALAAGATDFLTKPFDQTEVVLRVRNLLRTKALHRGLSARNATLRSELAERERRERQAAAQQAERVSRVRRVLDGASIEMVFQPIVELESSRVVGLEALARFTGPPRRPPNEW
ncbi:MAG TPA: response regulator, partial [Acidimicrobiales bacterium]|nr:response regulator [Acidimicrobiales bacterium]